jgi:hypothetical protein
MTNGSTLISGYSLDIKSMHSIPVWAQSAIIAGVYQQGRADALKYALDEQMKKVNPK